MLGKSMDRVAGEVKFVTFHLKNIAKMGDIWRGNVSHRVSLRRFSINGMGNHCFNLGSSARVNRYSMGDIYRRLSHNLLNTFFRPDEESMRPMPPDTLNRFGMGMITMVMGQ